MKTNLKVLGYRVLIKPDPIEEVTKAGIIIQTDEKIEKASQITGIVVSIGDKAFKDISDGEAWVKVGDRVLYAKYAGKRIKDPETIDASGKGEEYVVIADEDLLCRLEKGEE